MAGKKDTKKVTKSDKSRKSFHSSGKFDTKIEPNVDETVVKSGSKRKASKGVIEPTIKKLKPADYVVQLNVGGKLMETRASILRKYPNKLAADMFGEPQCIMEDRDGRLFIDCDGELFTYILNFLRFGTLPRKDKALEVYDLASYFRIEPLVEQLEQKYYAVQFQKKFCDMKESLKISGDTEYKAAKTVITGGIQSYRYSTSPTEDISIYETSASGNCPDCPIRPANVFVQFKLTNDTRALLMHELCELGYAKCIDAKKLDKKCKTCKNLFIGYEILLRTN